MVEETPIERPPVQQPVQFPTMSIMPTAMGIIIVIAHSPTHQETIIIPPANAHQMCKDWLLFQKQQADVMRAVQKAKLKG